ncbi:MAG: iron uptake porin [Oscillatoriales cyanobacterium RM2_1_1]|nr:iron uptake porin [Oscillatoriales cyanobacterium SM2_3_0]NJO46119.1 iron uptake porin [Oscillatoriales cyanobacterium RM2_1_1]
MNKILWNAIRQSPGVLGAVFLLANAALALETQSAGQDSVSAQSSSEVQVLEQFVSLPLGAEAEAPAQVISSESLANPEATVLETTQFQLAQTEPEAPETTNVSDLEQVNSYAEDPDAMDQVTSVSQLSDVQPTDWAFQALQSLVERYGCIAGYPDGTYKGNRAMTRFEFAAGLNACLERVNELIAASTANLVTREDLAVLQRLQEEFAAELAALRGRVLALEARTAELEANQFSTTTKLNGEVIFFAGDTFGDRATYNVNGDQGPDGTGLVDDDDDPTQTFLGYRVRLNFDTSFTGEDLLRTRLQAANIPNLSSRTLTNTLMTRLSTDGGDGTFELDDLYYRFPVFGNGQVFIGANSLDLDDLNEILSPLQSTGSGVSSRFGRYNPLIARGPQGIGGIFKYDFDFAKLTLGYLTGDGADANDGRGLFNGSYSASAQIVFEPIDDLGIAIEYSHRYFRDSNVDVSGGTGSFIARRPFGNAATSTDNLGFQLNWALTDWFELGGWFGVAWANQKSGGSDRSATILNGAVTLAFPDLLNDGDLGGILVGVPPTVVEHDITDLEDQDTSLHIEGFYRFQVNDYISVTPGFFVVTDPDHNSNNDTIFVGTLRTQFRF